MGPVLPRVTDVSCQGIRVADVTCQSVITDGMLAVRAVLAAIGGRGNWQRCWQLARVR